MIPRTDIEIRQEVDLAAVHEPGREAVDYPYWLGTQRDYDPGFYDDATWQLAEAALRDEWSVLESVLRRRRTRTSSMSSPTSTSTIEAALSGYLELGVTGLCIGLNAGGCVTASSCRGHVDSPRELPQVIFSCDRMKAELLVVLAREAGCGIENFEKTGLVLYAASIVELLGLGGLVLEHRGRFDALLAGSERCEPGQDA